MMSFMATVIELLRRRGPMEVFSLAAEARKLRPVKKDERMVLNEIFKSVKRGEHSLQVVEYPNYQLKGPVPRGLPQGRYVKSAMEALTASARPLGLDELTAHYCRRHGGGPDAVEFWMYAMLRSEGKRFVTQMGELRLGLKPDTKRQGSARASLRGAPVPESAKAEPIHAKMYEENLESLIAERLEEVEPGLTLVQRQYVTPVGRIDLLCKDRNGNFVVVELKRFRASTESIIDQVTRYIGWVQEHLARRQGTVRACIVVGKVDVKLEYSVRAIPNLRVKCLRVSLSDPE